MGAGPSFHPVQRLGAAAQLGAIQKSDTRQAVVARMLYLMDRAKSRGADFIVYPELALTTSSPTVT